MFGIGAGTVVGIVGVALTLLATVFKAGQWKSQMEDQHEEQANAHMMVHRDVEKILEHIDREAHSSRDDCPTCSDD